MCGIVGIWGFQNRVSSEILKKMGDTLSHRGPDDTGLFVDEQNNIVLGHRRLSIIELSLLGHQPLANDDESLWITYNGEVYNYKEIREELRIRGYKFKSNSDTEVVLKAYQEWGIKAVQKFRGMFAFAIWDKKKGKLIVFRDRAGVKPLYYYFDDQIFIFASEIKTIIAYPGFKKELDFSALFLFFRYGYIPAPYSVFKNIHKLEPGHFLEIDRNKKISKTKYWGIVDFYLQDFDTEQNNQKYNEKEIEEELEKILIDSFKLRLVSDVPVGIFLSGGIDSTLLTTLLKKNTDCPIRTFTLGFYEKEYNEAEYAKKIAKYLGTEHHEIYCTQKEALDVIPKLPEIYDEPFGDSSAIPTYLLSRFTTNYVKTSLSADGGDELFAGYNHYQNIFNLYQKFHQIPLPFLYLGRGITNIFSPEILSKVTGPILKSPNLENKFKKLQEILSQKINLENIYTNLQSYWGNKESMSLLGLSSFTPPPLFNEFEKIKNLPIISQAQVVDFKMYLCDDILTKVDRATMAVSLEGREPFLDQTIIEYVARLPLNLKNRNREKKYILKKILYKHIPREFLERPKHGFTIPINNWLKADLKPLLGEYLNVDKIKRQKIFNWKIADKELNDYFSGKSPYAVRVWLLLVFEMWYEFWME